MAKHPDICLRYFEARARAQFLRAYFAARGIEYVDERVPMDEGFAAWIAMREDRARTGPLQRLPVLHYGDQLIPETAVIAAFVHRTFGDAKVLTDAQNLRHDVLASTAHIDLLLPIAILIWADLMFQGIDLAAYAKSTLDRINKNLEVIEKSLAEWRWVEEIDTRPVTVGDCMLWEELDAAKTLFGPAISLEKYSELSRFYEQHPARETFERLLTENPCQISGRPDEATAIKKIQACLQEVG